MVLETGPSKSMVLAFAWYLWEVLWLIMAWRRVLHSKRHQDLFNSLFSYKTTKGIIRAPTSLYP